MYLIGIGGSLLSGAHCAWGICPECRKDYDTKNLEKHSKFVLDLKDRLRSYHEQFSSGYLYAEGGNSILWKKDTPEGLPSEALAEVRPVTFRELIDALRDLKTSSV